MAVNPIAYRGLFFSEATDRLARMRALVTDPTTPSSEQRMDDLHREVHTVRGSAAVVALEDVAETARLLEALVQRLRKGEASPIDGVEALIRGVDALTTEIANAAEREGSPDTAVRVRAAGVSAVVLVADDSMTSRAVVCDELRSQGYEVVEAEDGHRAVAAVLDSRPAAILLDVEMPGLDGYGVLEKLRTLPEARDIPVVMMTRRTETEDVVRALQLGALDYLKKPFAPVELVARVRVALRTKRLIDELKQRNAQLEEMARVDALTGLYNRRHLHHELRRTGASADRHGFPVSIHVIDVDHFKVVNDTRGHHAGDQVLVAVAAALRDSVRPEDTLGRWGGEEFLVLQPLADAAAAVALAERLRATIGAAPIALDDGDAVAITVSVGVATVPAGTDLEAGLRAADAALFTAKAQGRDRVVLATTADA